MNVHTFHFEAGADSVSLQSCSLRPKVHKGGRRRERYETIELRLLFYARPVGNGISKDLGVERSSYPNGVISCGAVESSSSRLGGSSMRSRFGAMEDTVVR